MRLKNNLYNILLNYLFIYILYIVIFLLFFQIYLLFSKLYIFNGDIYHGLSSYLLIIHSTLAISSNFFYYFLVFFLFIYILYNNIFLNNIRSIANIIYVSSIFISYHIFLFILTGIIWSDYSWGLFLPMEYRTIKLFFLLLIYITIYIAYIFLKKKFIYIGAVIICFIILFFIFDFFVIDIYKNSFEIHQNESSLHLFLLSVSGSYIFSIFLLIVYLLFLLFNIILTILYAESNKNNIYLNTFYNKNVYK